MLEVAADAEAFGVDVEGGLGGAGELVAEGDLLVDPFDDGLDASPAGGDVAEEFDGDGGEEVDFAIAAGEEEAEDFVGELGDGDFAGVGEDGVGESGIFDEGGVPNPQWAGGGEKTCANIAEAVTIVSRDDVSIDVDDVGLAEIGDAGRVDVELGHEGERGGAIELQVVTETNEHSSFDEPFLKAAG